jgi:Nucleoside-diphosphate-sugar epimerases
MKVFMIGGTGLLGSEAAAELIRRGHSVSSIALPPLPEGASLPSRMELSLGNYMTMGDEELRGKLAGCEGLVFAAGVDERVEGPPPIYEFFRRYNIDPLERLLRVARECGVRHAVVLGSYFAYFDRARPEWRLAQTHPYIRSRVDQAAMALSFASGGEGEPMDVAVLELPYIFGAQPGRKPVWLFLVERIRGMRVATFYPRGGTAMVTVKQVGQCVAGALERSRGGNRYPVGYFNLTWRELLAVVHGRMGMPERRIVTIPTWVFRAACASIERKRRAANVEGGLKMVQFASVMASELFIDQKTIVEELGVGDDDIEAAIRDSIGLCLDILDGKSEAIGMKGE